MRYVRRRSCAEPVNDQTWTGRYSHGVFLSELKRPELPIRVPVVGLCSGDVIRGDVVVATPHVIVLERTDDSTEVPPLGSPIRLRLEWDRHIIQGRVAANGSSGRFLVSVGERAIRRSQRYAVNLVGMVRSPHLHAAVQVHIRDLSAGGARIEGVELPIGAELELQFTPPFQTAPMSVAAFIAREIEGAEVPSLGVAFRTSQPALERLGRLQLVPQRARGGPGTRAMQTAAP